MATVIHESNGVSAWLALAKYLLDNGARTAPRGLPTLEDIDVVLRIDEPRDVLLTGIGRRYNTALASIEALQLIGGISVPQRMGRVAPRTLDFLDGDQFHGAYGPRLRSQIPAVVARLRRDRDTRQAVTTTWDPLRDLHIEGVKDYPCTVMHSFLIRRDKLVMHTTMRSNDLWWGVTYDIFMFTQLQLAMANALGVEAGPYYHHAVSMHLYERDLPAIKTVLERDSAFLTRETVPGIGNPDGESWDDIATRARDIIQGRYVTPYGGSHWHVTQALTWRDPVVC